MKLRVLFVSNLFQPDLAGGAAIHTDLCIRLKSAGHDVDVHTAYPYYPEWTNKSGKNLWIRAQETGSGISVTRHGLYIPNESAGLFSRTLQEVTFFLSLARNLFTLKDYDVVIATCPLLSTVVYAFLVSKIKHSVLWIYVQDIMSDAAAAASIVRVGYVRRTLEKIEDEVFSRADVVSTIAPKMVQRLESRLKRDVALVPNWLNSSMAIAIEKYGPKDDIEHGGPLRILYAGNIGKKQGLPGFCDELSKVDINYTFRIFGNGSDRSALDRWMSLAMDARFCLSDLLSEKEFIKQLFWADYFAIVETQNVGASFIPSKLIPCISTGTPVIAVCDRNGPLGQEVDEFGLGLIWRLGEIRESLQWLNSTSRKSEIYLQYRKNCLERSMAYDARTAVDSIGKIMQREAAKKTILNKRSAV